MASRNPEPVRYAVVGLGHIAQAAVLPAFAHAKRNSRLVAVVSDDAAKRRRLARRYGLERTFSYDEYDECLQVVDAVYIALPNSMHCEYTVRAARAGVHVLCEKPMAVTVAECRRMIDACNAGNVKLMIAYRLHFEEANLKAVDLARQGRLGEPRYFNSSFSMTVRAGNIRTRRETGGGTLYDIGIYCINAARYLFAAEPQEVTALSVSGSNGRIREVDETTAAIMRFDGGRIASFVTSFDAVDAGAYRLVGTKGQVRVDPAYDYAQPLAYEVTIGGRTQKKKLPKRDQFAPELIYFSECIRKGVQPEPSGEEGMQDMRIIAALYESARTGRAVRIAPFRKTVRPTGRQLITRPGVTMPKLVRAQSASV